VNECYAVLRAENLYTELLKDDAAPVAPGASGTAAYTVEGRSTGKCAITPSGGAEECS
jgi:hypothetical protein